MWKLIYKYIFTTIYLEKAFTTSHNKLPIRFLNIINYLRTYALHVSRIASDHCASKAEQSQIATRTGCIFAQLYAMRQTQIMNRRTYPRSGGQRAWSKEQQQHQLMEMASVYRAVNRSSLLCSRTFASA